MLTHKDLTDIAEAMLVDLPNLGVKFAIAAYGTLESDEEREILFRYIEKNYSTKEITDAILESTERMRVFFNEQR